MKYSSIAVAPLLLFLAACGGGGSTSGPLPPPATAPLDTQSELQSPVILPALDVAASTDLLYVGNAGNDSITVYRHDAAGNTAPLRVISGWKTRISSPGQLSEDARGNLYVANGRVSAQSATPGILVFARGASGNVAPIRKVAGSSTGLHNVGALTVDKTTGKIFVVDNKLVGGYGCTSSLVRFAPNANGNVAPLARSQGGLAPTEQLASDSTGRYVISGHSICIPSGVTAGIDTLFKQFASNTTPADPYRIDWFAALGVADDPTTKTYFASNHGIYRFAENTYGSPPDSIGSPTWTPAPLSVITSDTCGTQLALARGSAPNVYVTHSTLSEAFYSPCATDAVYVYKASANGNAVPLRILSGLATKLNKPFGIYEGL
jgi:hypothetical protein